ncbi:MAG: UDP-N-acetylglucosamine 1-carboxyvinyltransferase [Oscillospiraceae bacterium]|jgi:UDP-N-acetylglucosamine 1-carboxyvinyltransferase|nr:UDP-N-acetylglucosamine 1-carboxyvinyltransferase [Oscillospiraceae bacterium]
MSILKINGGRELRGRARIQGAKNSVLPILAASLLADGETVIHNCPKLSDVEAASKILKHLGCSAKRDGDAVTVNSTGLSRLDIPHGLMREMRSSVIFLGAMLARGGEATLSLPGGCELGPRPIDLHLMALRELGADITEEGGSIICRASRLRGRRVNLSFPSVGATENTMLAASLADGTTIITNAAREPEIWDLQSYLRTLGVNVSGAGTPTVTVEGTKIRADVSHSIIPDRIAAATYLAAAAVTKSEVELTGVIPKHLATVTEAIREMGCDVRSGRETLHISSDGRLRAPKPIVTEPHPGFPTDAQPQIMAAALRARGTTAFVENIFENRYRHVGELRRLGAEIKIEGRVAMVTGVEKLTGAPVTATDLRGGAALVIAALGAEGVTEISGLHHIDRGYDGLENTLRSIGADIERI